MKKMLMINGSPRSSGSSAEILKAIEKKVSSAYECEIIDLGKLKISHCIGCLSCKKTGECAIKDDMIPLYAKLQDADSFVLSVPVYFGAETGLLKNFIDRLYAIMKRTDKGYDVNFGKKKTGIAAVCCGAPDGNMVYHGVMTHLVNILRTFGAADVASAVIPGASAGVKDSPFLKDLLDAIEFQMSL